LKQKNVLTVEDFKTAEAQQRQYSLNDFFLKEYEAHLNSKFQT
jgi:hypothetical protein